MDEDAVTISVAMVENNKDTAFLTRLKIKRYGRNVIIHLRINFCFLNYPVLLRQIRLMQHGAKAAAVKAGRFHGRFVNLLLRAVEKISGRNGDLPSQYGGGICSRYH